MKDYRYLLFDFDGTISKSAEGVRICIERTLNEMKKPCPKLDDYSRYIGPPLTQTFEKLCGLTREESFDALPIYRAYYDDVGIYQNAFYDGMDEVLSALKHAPVKTAVCTSKNERLAIRSMEAIGAKGLVDAICGSLDSGARKEKGELIDYALSTLGCCDKSEALMIGDTFFDAKGAKEAGVDFLGVLYGYGDEKTLKDYPAIGYAKTPREILSFLKSK